MNAIADGKTIVNRGVEACEKRDAALFASLFAPEGKLCLMGGQTIQGREAIAKVTADYFAHCSEIAIAIEQIGREGDRFRVEWHWYSRERATGKEKRAKNAIDLDLDLRDGAILSWRETSL